MLKIEPNETVTLSYRKYKDINDPNEVMIHYNTKFKNEKIDENIIRCLITYIKNIKNTSCYFRFHIDNELITITSFYRRKMIRDFIEMDNYFYNNKILFMSESFNDEEFIKMKERILKLNNIKNN